LNHDKLNNIINLFYFATSYYMNLQEEFIETNFSKSDCNPEKLSFGDFLHGVGISVFY